MRTITDPATLLRASQILFGAVAVNMGLRFLDTDSALALAVAAAAVAAALGVPTLVRLLEESAEGRRLTERLVESMTQLLTTTAQVANELAASRERLDGLPGATAAVANEVLVSRAQLAGLTRVAEQIASDVKTGSAQPQIAMQPLEHLWQCLESLPDDRRPLRERVAQRLREAITAGRFPAGVPLPSNRQIASHLKVSAPVVGAAKVDLRGTGHLEKQDGKLVVTQQ